MGQRTAVQRPRPSSDLKAQKITAFGECPGGKEGGHPSAWGKAGSFPPSRNQRETGPGPPCPRGPRPGRQLNFLGFSADLVIVVNADGDKKEAAGQEQQDPQGHEARFGECGSDHCGRKAGRGQRSEEACALTPTTGWHADPGVPGGPPPCSALSRGSCQLSDPTDISVLRSHT